MTVVTLSQDGASIETDSGKTDVEYNAEDKTADADADEDGTTTADDDGDEDGTNTADDDADGTKTGAALDSEAF